MNPGTKRQRAILSWLYVCALFVLCGILGLLQYRWITEVSVTAGERLRASLQRSLAGLSQDFDSEIVAACAALTPASSAASPQELQNEAAERYTQWTRSTRRGRLFEHLAMAIPDGDAVELRLLDPDRGVFRPAAWPAAWESMKERLESNLSQRDHGPERGPDRRPPPQEGELQRRPPPRAGGRSGNGFLFEEPLFAFRSGVPGGEAAWLLFELNPAYLRETLLPQMVQRDLGADYQVVVVTNSDPASVIYRSDASESPDIAASADASVSLFDPPSNLGFRRAGPPDMHDPRGRGTGPGSGRGPGRGPGPDSGRWRMFVRHRAGSLAAVAAESRFRSMAITGGVLLLMLATAAALIRYTRRAQRLADLQMEFVAGVSHELRTPLTVIQTAAYNLQGKLAGNPVQVEKYGALIQRESGRLGELVEQVLQFASINAGRVPQERERLSVETVIDETIEANKAMIESTQCTVVKAVDPGLPAIWGDPRALRQVMDNLLRNAAKYGTHTASNGTGEGSNWIGIFATKAAGGTSGAVEIRVSDHGPGIPADERQHIFDPFFRGTRAVQDQIHGTGLGLSLVKKIVESHGGSVRVKSEPMKGAEFIVLLPAAPAGAGG